MGSKRETLRTVRWKELPLLQGRHLRQDVPPGSRKIVQVPQESYSLGGASGRPSEHRRPLRLRPLQRGRDDAITRTRRPGARQRREVRLCVLQQCLWWKQKTALLRDGRGGRSRQSLRGDEEGLRVVSVHVPPFVRHEC